MFSGADSNSVRQCVLAVFAVIAAVSGTAVADVDLSVDNGARTGTQALEMLPLAGRQSPPSPLNVTRRVNSVRTSPPPVNFTDILSTAGLDYPTDTDRYPPVDTRAPAAKTVHQLPAGPGAATLCLMGMGCLGAVKFGRSARNLSLQSLPDWYHTGGPMRIGGADAFDFDYHTVVFRTLDEPPVKRQFNRHPRRDIPSRREDQFFLAVEAPRGPPASHS